MARTQTGQVTSVGGQQTIVIRVDRRVSHPIYKKQFNKSNKFSAHDEKEEAKVGDIVEVAETKPISRTKSWKLVRVVEKAKVIGGEN